VVGIVNREEGRTHMMREHRNLIGWPSLIAGGLLAAACTDQPNVNMAPNRPSYWLTPPPAQCVTGKWTGGGRIDPTGNRAASNYDNVDEPAGGQPAAPDPAPYMTGKVTFGFNVFLGQDANGNCIVQKGEIEVNGHAQKLAWHVSIHNGVDAYDGRPVYANEFSDGHPGGVCVVVGIPDRPLPDGYMTARVNPGQGRETAQFEVCDNDRGGRQNTRSDAMRWRVAPLKPGETGPSGDTGLTYLTGGNIVEHGS
jgi:hypothetical protein